MEQRRLRLGDILDDYCPRERRVTNHVVAAMIEDEVKQTRCSTCDADHEYRQAKVPPPRRRKDVGALVASGDASPRARRPVAPDTSGLEPGNGEVPIADLSTPADVGGSEPPAPDVVAASTSVEVPLDAIQGVPTDAALDAGRADHRDDDGPVHRRLIRATLPRPEGQAPERKEPDFTVRQPGRGMREVDGNRPQGGHRRHRRSPHSGDSRSGAGQNGNVHHGGQPHRRGPRGHSPQGGQSSGHPQGPRSDRQGSERGFRRRRGR